jgi:hypothetical protein
MGDKKIRGAIAGLGFGAEFIPIDQGCREGKGLTGAENGRHANPRTAPDTSCRLLPSRRRAASRLKREGNIVARLSRSTLVLVALVTCSGIAHGQEYRAL